MITKEDEKAVFDAIQSKPNGASIFGLMSKCPQVANLMTTVQQLKDDGKIVAKTYGEWPERMTLFFAVD